MKVHTDWGTAAFDFPPVAGNVGPFAGRAFLGALRRHDAGGDLWLAESPTALLPLVLRGDRLAFVGHADLVDYRSPLGEGVASLVAEVIEAAPGGTTFEFDSLPREATSAVADGMAGRKVTVEQHALTAVLELPDTREEHLLRMGKKERHELRRKLRRFEAELGEPALITQYEPGEDFARFVAMHRRSPGAKGSFMTESVEALFAGLLASEGWRLDLLHDGLGTTRAAAFSWADDHSYYLYNSAYDVDRAAASPGFVLLAALIERAIDEGRRVFDFLKGDEPDKFRMGARPRPLYSVRGET